MSQYVVEYSITEVSRRLGVPVQLLRRWDEQGVLVARRTDGGHRRYPQHMIDSLASSSLNQVGDVNELMTVKKSLDEKRRIIQLLLESENRYRDLVETSHDLIWATDAQGRFTYLNNATHDIFGMPPKDLLGRCFFDFEAYPSYVSNRRFLATLKRNGEVRDYVTCLVTLDGEDRWVGINARVAIDENGVMTAIRGTARDITELHTGAQKIKHLAMHDTLTDLPNRLSLQQVLEDTMRADSIGAVMFLDIDHFKYINDTYGHQAGDRLIVGVGGVLRDVLAGFGAELYRIGGDEFAVHLPESLRQEAMFIAEKILDAIRHYRFQHPGSDCATSLTASIGIALYPFHGNDLAGLLSNVDIAMYQAKDHGRNRYALFDQDLDNIRSIHRRVHWANGLRDAMAEDRFVLYAQPVVRLSDQQAVHHEILVRIRERSGSIVPPSHFIELAESLGLIQDIDMCVVQKLLGHMCADTGQGSRYFVNLSRVSISDQSWVRRFQRMLEDSGVSLNRLVFEITETAAMSDVNVTLSFIHRLREMGCRFALDDFGAGFSSFFYLKRFDVDYLKIDGSFIRDLVTDQANQLFVKALNDVAQGLGKQVIAEWVETQEVAQLLMDMGAQYGQGYLFQRPMPLGETPQLPMVSHFAS